MTKVSVFGQQPTETKELKKIEFVKWLKSYENEHRLRDSNSTPSSWGEVCLLVKKYQRSEYDLIFTRGVFDGEFRTCIFLGHWNDGVV
jgi:hypothetical protein